MGNTHNVVGNLVPAIIAVLNKRDPMFIENVIQVLDEAVEIASSDKIAGIKASRDWLVTFKENMLP